MAITNPAMYELTPPFVTTAIDNCDGRISDGTVLTHGIDLSQIVGVAGFMEQIKEWDKRPVPEFLNGPQAELGSYVVRQLVAIGRYPSFRYDALQRDEHLYGGTEWHIRTAPQDDGTVLRINDSLIFCYGSHDPVQRLGSLAAVAPVFERIDLEQAAFYGRVVDAISELAK